VDTVAASHIRGSGIDSHRLAGELEIGKMMVITRMFKFHPCLTYISCAINSNIVRYLISYTAHLKKKIACEVVRDSILKLT